jgi:hypothetical protein
MNVSMSTPILSFERLEKRPLRGLDEPGIQPKAHWRANPDFSPAIGKRPPFMA